MSEETRSKALDKLITGDADLYDANSWYSQQQLDEIKRFARHDSDCASRKGIYLNASCDCGFAQASLPTPSYASARIKGDKDRATQSIAPAEAEIERLTKCLAKANAGFEEYERRYLLGCDDIERLTAENGRLRTVLQYIADAAYVDHQSGNENFEHLQSIARDALKGGQPHA